MGKSIWYKPHS